MIQASCGSSNFGDCSRNLFCSHFLPSADSRTAVVSFWQKNVHKCWLATSKTKLAQEKCGLVN